MTPAERLLDLVIALTHTEHRMTKADVRATVNGYSQASNDDAFERMFERDKVTLRELGIPLVTLTDDAHGDDIGYRIDLDGYDLPRVDLSPAEIGVLSVAAQVWDGAHLDLPARRALTKLRAVSPAASGELSGHVLRIPPPSATFDPLLSAIASRAVVTFGYRGATSSAPAQRRVEPWQLVVRDGAWYVLGHDLVRDAERMFRLTRITGAVKVGARGGATHPRVTGTGGGLGATSRASGSIGRTVGDDGAADVARVAVRPERAGEVRLRALAATPGEAAWSGWDVLELAVGNADDLAGLLAGHTDAVVVLEPPHLREAVVTRLRAAAGLATVGTATTGTETDPVSEPATDPATGDIQSSAPTTGEAGRG
ncbi:putative DeoR-family transcriptional regulator [Serinibacter arcticus]|uniref:Putative DeoR-family transcriptional regulator n=1 Tax=Serinibacter arcticus TaxID=1655435 RepID=A0A4Z1E022_9MICO|nr:putative DeoR-family transcriptional regulator [Serinibacter arcticus]